MSTELIKDFNDVLLSLAMNVADVCPSSFIGSNIDFINKTITQNNSSNKFIESFCLSVLQYKEQIDSGDEKFFLNKDYKNDLKGYNDILSNVITLKSVWKELKPENKQIVMTSMQILCELSQQYFILTY